MLCSFALSFHLESIKPTALWWFRVGNSFWRWRVSIRHEWKVNVLMWVLHGVLKQTMCTSTLLIWSHTLNWAIDESCLVLFICQVNEYPGQVFESGHLGCFGGPGIAICIELLRYKGIPWQTLNEASSCVKRGLVREIRRLREEHTDLVLCGNEWPEGLADLDLRF